MALKLKRLTLPVALAAFLLIVAITASGCDSRKTTITFLFQNSRPKEAGAFWQQIEADFEAENPDIDVKIINYDWAGTADDFKRFENYRLRGSGNLLLDALINEGNPPDLARIPTRDLPKYIFAGHLEAIDAYVTPEFLSEFYPLLISEGAQYQGRTFGLPIAFTTRAMYYNKGLLAQAGITEAPRTWDDLKAAAIAVGNLDGDAAGFGLQGKASHSETSTYFYYFLWGNGGSVLTPDGTRATFNSQAGVEALQFLIDLKNAGGTQADPTLDDRAALETAFVKGQDAMVITFNRLAGRVQSESPDIQYDIAPIPYNNTPVTLAVTDSLVMFKNSPNKEAAWKFVEFLYQDKYRAQSFVWEGVLPEKSTLEEDPTVAGNPTVSFFLDLAPIARFQPLNVKNADIATIVGEELAKAYSGEKDAQTALDDAAARVNEVLSYSATSW